MKLTESGFSVSIMDNLLNSSEKAAALNLCFLQLGNVNGMLCTSARGHLPLPLQVLPRLKELTGKEALATKFLCNLELFSDYCSYFVIKY